VLGRPVVDATFSVVGRRSLVVSRSRGVAESRSRGVASPRVPAFAKATAGKPSTKPTTEHRVPSPEHRTSTQQESE
jgi:hypothetical protein